MSKILTAKDVMKKPQPLITLRDGPGSALRIMKEHGISSIFVTDRDRYLKGILTVDQAVDAKQKNFTSLSEVELSQSPVLTEDTLIQDIIATVAESKLPTAVVNADNKLVGILVRGAVLAALSNVSGGGSHE